MVKSIYEKTMKYKLEEIVAEYGDDYSLYDSETKALVKTIYRVNI